MICPSLGLGINEGLGPDGLERIPLVLLNGKLHFELGPLVKDKIPSSVRQGVSA
jgi:hypothetical protein